MKLVPLSQIFTVKYGNKLNANALAPDSGGINFVNRSRRRLGISATVKRLPTEEANPAGSITVTLGGTYLLSAFVQPSPFYTAQNVKVLTPIDDMSFAEKVFYCVCISKNRYRYSSHGREANRSLNSLLVPSRNDIPSWATSVAEHDLSYDFDQLYSDKPAELVPSEEVVSLAKIFDLYNGVNPPAHYREDSPLGPHHLPLLRPSKEQSGSFVEYVDRREIDPRHVYPEDSLYISTNGQGSHTYAYVAPFEFVPNSDVTVAVPKREMSTAEKLFYAMVISKNRGLFSYGRKPKGTRLADLVVPAFPPPYVFKAPVTGQTAAA